MFKSIRSHIFYFISFHATLNAIVAIGDPSPFDPLEHFFQILEVEYGGMHKKSNVENPLGWNKNNFVLVMNEYPKTSKIGKVI
jgi:hypothetical protein